MSTFLSSPSYVSLSAILRFSLRHPPSFSAGANLLVYDRQRSTVPRDRGAVPTVAGALCQRWRTRCANRGVLFSAILLVYDSQRSTEPTVLCQRWRANGGVRYLSTTDRGPPTEARHPVGTARAAGPGNTLETTASDAHPARATENRATGNRLRCAAGIIYHLSLPIIEYLCVIDS
jgi:hypothetical protein